MIMGPGIASSLPASSPLEAVPLTADPATALQALTQFFEHRQMLMREDFLQNPSSIQVAVETNKPESDF